MILYHYTCSHGFAHIRRERMLRPMPHLLIRSLPPLIWLTDMDSPSPREALGLTSMILACDRTEWRVEVDTGEAMRWAVFARTLPRNVRDLFESTRGARPAHWWVSTEVLPIVEIVSTRSSR